MEISPRRSISLDLDTSIASLAASSYPPNSGNWRTNMYTMQAMKANGEANVRKVPVRMTTSLSVDSGSKCTATPKRVNFFTSMFGALTSIVAERLGKVPSTFMSNIHNTLSVTVVPNEGIISQDFFKNLTRSYEQLATEQKRDTIENPTETTDKFSNKSMYNIASPMSYVFTDGMRQSALSGKVSLNLDCDSESRLDETRLPDSPIVSKEIFNELDVRDVPEDSRAKEPTILDENSSTMRDDNIQSERVSASTSTIATNEEKTNRVEALYPSRSAVPELTEPHESMDTSGETCSTTWQTMWHKVVNGMSERFGTSRAVSPDSEVPTKKPNLSKPTKRKTCTVARVRGKGRGKSQLRRNGVSQSRHRKERTKQNIYSNIQDDLNAWEDSEQYLDGSEDDDSSVNDQRSIDQPDYAPSNSRDVTDSFSPYPHCATLLESLSCDGSANVRKRKQTLHKSASSCPMRVRYVPELSIEVESHDSPYTTESTDCSLRLEGYRPRLVSESSVDSEDSYCIVFEHGSESEYTDYDYDEINDEASDIVSDKEFDDDDKGTPMVRFNLKPEVHTMIKWDYAYRAARRGPWEEMARDRERFRGRIRCVETILNPILSGQHRNCIWQERFNVDEQSGRTAQALF